MLGPEIICRTMSHPRLYGTGDHAHMWQYHSRSDFHSKVAAIALMIDLMQESPELRADIAAGDVGYSVNPQLRDRSNRVKTLDMRFARIDDAAPLPRPRNLERFAEDLGLDLTEHASTVLHGLPTVREARSKQDLVVFENKACMTAFSKAAPRLRNELEGAVVAINDSDPLTVAGGLVLINAADTFVSQVFRDNGYVEPAQRRVSHHAQPEDAHGAVEKLRRIPLRKTASDGGYDALGTIVVSARNDGSPWTVVTNPTYGAPDAHDIWNYTRLVQHMAKLYRQRFK
jgi:hypothetical protein